jgi:ParB family chromosome partitioning protein
MTKKKLTFAHNPLFGGPALADRERGVSPYREVSLELVDRDPNQPRVNFDEDKLNELADSIRRYGVIQPILIRPSKTAGRYTVISGERRLRASKLAGLEVIPAIVDTELAESSDSKLSVQLVENIQRSDLTPLERAHAIGALKEAHSLSVRDIAERLGVSKSMVQRSLDILELPDDLLNALREGASESKILLLAKIEDPEVRAGYLSDIDTLTRKDIEKNIEEAANSDSPAAEEVELSPEDLRLIEEMRRGLGMKVKLSRSSANPERGRISIDFYSNEDFQVVFRRLVAEV